MSQYVFTSTTFEFTSDTPTPFILYCLHSAGVEACNGEWLQDINALSTVEETAAGTTTETEILFPSAFIASFLF